MRATRCPSENTRPAFWPITNFVRPSGPSLHQLVAVSIFQSDVGDACTCPFCAMQLPAIATFLTLSSISLTTLCHHHVSNFGLLRMLHSVKPLRPRSARILMQPYTRGTSQSQSKTAPHVQSCVHSTLEACERWYGGRRLSSDFVIVPQELGQQSQRTAMLLSSSEQYDVSSVSIFMHHHAKCRKSRTAISTLMFKWEISCISLP